MEHMSVEAQRRSADVTKSERNRLRRAGHIPGAIFGKGFDPLLVTVEARDIARILNSEAGENTLIDLSLEGQRHLVKLTEVDLDPISRKLQHIGLHKLQTNELTKASIPVELVGEPADVAHGLAILEPGVSSVDVKCLPDALIGSLRIDISSMAIGDVKYVSDLDVPENIEVMTSADSAIVSVHVARTNVETAEEDTAEASAEAAAE